MSNPRNTAGHALLKDAKWLDAFAKFFDAVVGGFYKIPGTGVIKTLLHGTWPLHHPLHPAVTDITIGAYTAMFALDMLYLVSRDASRLHDRRYAPACRARGAHSDIDSQLPRPSTIFEGAE